MYILFFMFFYRQSSLNIVTPSFLLLLFYALVQGTNKNQDLFLHQFKRLFSVQQHKSFIFQKFLLAA